MTQRAAVNETLLKASIMAEDKSGDMSERGDRRGERHCDDRGVETGGRVVADQSVIYPVDSAPPFTPYYSLWITGKYTSHIITQLALISFFPCCVMCTIGLELKKEPSNLIKTHTCRRHRIERS